ncbi:MAG: FumA C-terminus/TtdB family hydratase beta subunit [Bacteroidota bacterium]|nr:FumA C-terminus/TtdB family hydratase beta subunit [Bacteroidota bacterium]
MTTLEQSIYDLIVQTSTNLPSDVRRSMVKAHNSELQGTKAGIALDTITKNIDMACSDVGPICQDTGMPTFEVKTPVGFDQIILEEIILLMVAKATKDGKLRTNSVDPIDGSNTGNNIGPGTPVIHFHQHRNDYIDIRLILKGGGCENKNIQYSLPSELEHLGKAGRDIDGIRKCIMHAVWQAQGQGCSAGFIGVGIGGDRTSGYALAKEQLFRNVDDENPDPVLRDLENYIMNNADKLKIGTMGFGGLVTLLGCKIGKYNRLPASFFVSVAYNCWAYRRLGIKINAETGSIINWLYRDADEPKQMYHEPQGEETSQVRVHSLTPPISEEQVRAIKAGDVVELNGIIYTGRDAMHHYMLEHDAPYDLHGAVIYHCGPVINQDAAGKWKITAAGPTTSIREEPYQGTILKKTGARVVMGKGGMGPKTLQACQEHGAIYLNAIGGAAQYYARCIKDVIDGHCLQFGTPEAMWQLEVEGFRAICTMDSHGTSLHKDVLVDSGKELEQFAAKVF